MAVRVVGCEDWALRERLLTLLRRKGREELLRAIEVITEYLEGKETFEELIALFEEGGAGNERG